MRVQPVARRPFAVVLMASLAATAVAGCQPGDEPEPVAAAVGEPPQTIEVVEVVDAATLEVLRGGTSEIVRLLGVEPPVADDCLGGEATRLLTQLLPAGTEVRLEPGKPSDAAAVYAGELLVNAELVRHGLALTSARKSGPISEEIAEAESEAVEAGAGVFGTEAECTLPSQVAALEEAEAEAADAAAAVAVGIGFDEIDRHGAAIAAVAATGTALAALLEGDGSSRYPAGLLADLRTRTQTVNGHLTTATAHLGEVRVAEEQRVEAERVAAEAAAQAEEAARQAAEAEAAAAAAAAAEEAAANAPSSVYYPNCTAVRAAGAAPIYVGEPGYSRKLDRDGDGVACEN